MMTGPEIKIGSKKIDNYSKPYLIAEIGVNFYDIASKENISLIKAAKLMISEAKKAGCDAVKFQSYKADTLAAEESPAYWDTTKETTKSQYELFRKFDKFSKLQYEDLKKYCVKFNTDFLCTPFDLESVDYLDKLVAAYKIASADLTNYPLLKSVAGKNKTIMISTGASDVSEIDSAIKFLKNNGAKDIVIMHCVLNYPTIPENANLSTIKMFKERYPDYLIGYSDHVLPDKGLSVLQDAYMLGAVIIEKHFTLDKSLKGNDHYHAMDPDDIKDFVKIISKKIKLLGSPRENHYDFENISRKEARRGTYAAKDLKKGEILEESSFILKRPSRGIKPEEVLNYVGRKINKNIKKDKIISAKDFIK